jgi:catechol 2,3-dioxygenase-like lactoylglutathione lyase family enzyme
MPLGVIGVDHVQITVPRALEDECLAFYRQVLGLAEIPKPADLRARGGAWFQLSNLQFHIGLDAEPSPASRRHICFRVSDIIEARAELEARGVAVEAEGVAEGMRRFFVRDPAGNRIELAQT